MNVPEDNMSGRDELSHEDEDVEYERFVRSLTDMVGDLDGKLACVNLAL